MNDFLAALHEHAKTVFLNSEHSATKRNIIIDGVAFVEVDSQLTDIEDTELKSRNVGEYVEGVFSARKQLIVAIDAFGFIPVFGAQIFVDDEAFIIDWVGDREGLLYLKLSRPTM